MLESIFSFDICYAIICGLFHQIGMISCLRRTVALRCSFCFVAAVTVVVNVGSDTVHAVQMFCYVLGRKWCKFDFFLNKEEDFERKDAEGDGKSFKNSITKTK